MDNTGTRNLNEPIILSSINAAAQRHVVETFEGGDPCVPPFGGPLRHFRLRVSHGLPRFSRVQVQICDEVRVLHLAWSNLRGSDGSGGERSGGWVVLWRISGCTSGSGRVVLWSDRVVLWSISGSCLGWSRLRLLYFIIHNIQNHRRFAVLFRQDTDVTACAFLKCTQDAFTILAERADQKITL